MEKPLNAAMPVTSTLRLTDCLPLTCTRTGACCHGKMVWLNPWELALHLGRGLGANPVELAGHWIVTAKKLGAQE
jgi:hypothetical protein